MTLDPPPEGELAVETCQECGRQFHIWEEGYLGPLDPSEEKCSPLSPLVSLCGGCELELFN